MNGFECLSDIRLIKKCAKIPVVIYSGTYNDSEVSKLREMGATRYLQKPSSFHQLKDMLLLCLNGLHEGQFQKENTEKNFVILA